jgi:4-amino-4-deoxy-L-arabinose transferase-like glycosyltransferase
MPPLALAMLAALGTTPVLRSLLVPDVNWCYPYMSPDSYDWINNGLSWAGAPVAPTLRPPGFPLVIAALWKLGLLSFLPVANFLFLGLSTAALYLLLRERHDAWIAAAACWFYFANGYVQDFTRYLMAETYAVPFLILAALAFVRAARAPRAWILFGLSLGTCVLFSYAAAPAAAGFGASFLAVSRADLRRKEPWAGAAAAAAFAGGWFAFRRAFYVAHPAWAHHGVEALLRPSFSNVPFYAFDALALLGVVPLALYAGGALRFGGGGMPARYRAAVLGPLAALSLFFVFLYDWADKRFLLYVLPFLVCVLAEGLGLLREIAHRGRMQAAGAGAFLLVALLWNQIRYPSYGIDVLALTPVHFLQARTVLTDAQKTEFRFDAMRVVRPYARVLGAFSHALFDPRRVEVPCALSSPAYTCLPALGKEADRVLPAGKPLGLLTPRGWPHDAYASRQRLANAILRPVVVPGEAEVALAGIEAVPAGLDVARPPFVASCGPYVLVRTR